MRYVDKIGRVVALAVSLTACSVCLSQNSTDDQNTPEKMRSRIESIVHRSALPIRLNDSSSTIVITNAQILISAEDIQQIKQYGERAIPVLSTYLLGESPRSERVAIRLLGVIGGPAIVDPLAKVLNGSPRPGSREEALRSLHEASREPGPADVRIGHDVVVENQPVLWAFLEVLRGTGVKGGFAAIADCSDLPRGTLKLKQGVTLHEAMDALVAANPSYRWQLEDGVVVLMPTSGVSFLNTKIGKFQMDATDREIPAILHELLRLPEVQASAAQLYLKPGLGQGGPGVYDEHPVQTAPARIHADWRNFSLLDGFNRVVQTSQKAVWIYRETDCGGDKTYTIEVASDY
jgi:hypothetical protein